jgi:hypothetical protein
MSDATSVPLEYVLGVSDTGLLNLEQVHLEHAANLRKEIGAMEKEYERERTIADVARWFIEHRKELLETTKRFKKNAA